MYKVLLRDVREGTLKWWDNCYYASKMKKNKVILWKSPEDKDIKSYKIVAWKWQGKDTKIDKNPRWEKCRDIADEVLMSFKPRRNDYWQSILKEASNKSKQIYENNAS